ncbi:MAG: lipopolysaccharide heptosyltransferase II [Candidatus Omnitrophota bacterium]
MKIVQISPRLNTGGVETGTVDLAVKLLAMGHHPIVISGGGELVKFIEQRGIKHYCLPVYSKNPFVVLRMMRAVTRILIEEKADIVHARSRVPAIIGYYASKKSRTTFITTCHGYYSKRLVNFGAVMGWGKFVIAISQVIARHMMEDFKVPYRRLRLVYRGVNLDKFTYKEPSESFSASGAPISRGEFTIGIIGRLSPIKGHTFFLRSVGKAVKFFPRLKVLIVGDALPDKADYKRELEDLTRKLGLGRNVEFLGRREDIPDILSRLDLLVLATITQEGFGRVIIEAFASGVPVLATSVGGVTEIIRNGDNGLLVASGDPQAMSDAIVKALKDRRLAKNLAVRARKDVEERYNLEKMAAETVKVYKEALEAKRILIIKLGAVGDCVLATPSIRAVRQENPKAFIALLIGRQASQVLKGCPYIDEMIVYDRKGRDKGWLKFFRLAKEIKGYGFEEILDLQHNFRSHLLAFLSGAPARFGYRKGRFWFLLNRAADEVNRPVAPVDHQFRLLKLMGIETASQHLELWPSSNDEERVGRILDNEWVGDKQILVGINPGASPRWATKKWPLENFAGLCDALAQEEIRAVLIGGKSETGIGAKLSLLTKSKPINLIGRTSLTELAALMKRLKCLVTSDSAPMHIAAAMDTAFVALFGPTSPLRHLPPAKNRVVIAKDFKCVPCYKNVCSDVRCMCEITVEEVLRAVKDMVKR